MNEWKFSTEYENYEQSFRFDVYSSNGATAVLYLPYTKVSVNMEDAPILPRGQFYLKDWSGNELIAKAMINEKLIEPVKAAIPAQTGYVVAHPYQFTEDGLKYVENAVEFLQLLPKREDIQMFIDDWPNQETKSLWLLMQSEYPQTLRDVIGNDCPSLDIAATRLRTWLEVKRINVPKYPDIYISLESEMISCALSEVDWPVLIQRIAHALNIPVCGVSDIIVCPKCQGPICQWCFLCPNPSCEDAHRIDCLSENSSYQLGPILFDFADRKLVIRVGEAEIPVSYKEYRRFYNWIDIRKNG